MGGPGSGNRYSRFGTKLTVEESLAVESAGFSRGDPVAVQYQFHVVLGTRLL